ncbi:MAG: helix-turn-helix domain-containing protein [Sphingomonadaceae bacterium]
MRVERWTLGGATLSARASSLSDAISQAFGRCDCGYEAGNEEVAASFVKIGLGPMTLIRYFGQGRHWAERRHDHVRRQSSDDFLFYLPHNNRVTIHQGGLTSLITAGQIGFVNTRRAYRGTMESLSSGEYESTHLVIPGAILRSRFPNIDDLAGQSVAIGESLHDMISAYARTLGSKDYGVEGASERALSNIMFETLCAIADYALETRGHADRPSPSRGRGLERIQTFILANLSDPNLCVSMIAERLNMSQRYVHSSFEGSDWTVKNWIKHKRLLECRKAIQSAAMRDRTLTEIAFSWGFSDFSHFSRCYKAKFGLSPKEDRLTAAA